MTTRSTLTLRGDRNQCPGCGEHFNSNYAFDTHRIGDHGKDRRCMVVDEMLDAGMVKRADQFWVSAARPDDLPRGSDGPGKPGPDES